MTAASTGGLWFCGAPMHVNNNRHTNTKGEERVLNIVYRLVLPLRFFFFAPMTYLEKPRQGWSEPKAEKVEKNLNRATRPIRLNIPVHRHVNIWKHHPETVSFVPFAILEFMYGVQWYRLLPKLQQTTGLLALPYLQHGRLSGDMKDTRYDYNYVHFKHNL